MTRRLTLRVKLEALERERQTTTSAVHPRALRGPGIRALGLNQATAGREREHRLERCVTRRLDVHEPRPKHALGVTSCCVTPGLVRPGDAPHAHDDTKRDRGDERREQGHALHGSSFQWWRSHTGGAGTERVAVSNPTTR